MVIGRGEAIRNFLYSDTLDVLCERARVTLLSVVHDEKFISRFSPYTERIIPLKTINEKKLVKLIRYLTLNTHYRWLWTEKARNKWEILNSYASNSDNKLARVNHVLWKAVLFMLANRPSVMALTWLDRSVSWLMRPSTEFDKLFSELKPDLIFNTSHIHGEAADLPMRVAQKLNIPTAVFVFSWDNLTSRSRILVPYDFYIVWHQKMKDKLLDIYPELDSNKVYVTGTPQFDFHFKPEFYLSREELLTRFGGDPTRPYILYTTGMASDMPGEHLHIRSVINLIQEIKFAHQPQLIVRTYIKGTSDETKAIAKEKIPGVIFPQILWDKRWFVPYIEDLHNYSSLLRHTILGINAASTVSLELMMHDKPVINIAFDPPGCDLPNPLRWARWYSFEHYRPVAESGSVMIARSVKDLAKMIDRGLTNPLEQSEARRQFIQSMFNGTLDGLAGRRVAERLVDLALEGDAI